MLTALGYKTPARAAAATFNYDDFYRRSDLANVFYGRFCAVDANRSKRQIQMRCSLGSLMPIRKHYCRCSARFLCADKL
jgi:hypothetical protein